MKNIIERIAGGAKIARYLPKAVSTRLAVAALAALAAGGAWATECLFSNVDQATTAANKTDGAYGTSSFAFQLSNPSGSAVNNTTFPSTGAALITQISLAARENNNDQTATTVRLTGASGRVFTGTVKYLQDSTFTGTLSNGTTTFTRRAILILFDDGAIPVNVTETYTLAFYNSSGSNVTMGYSVVANGSNGWKPAMRIYGATLDGGAVSKIETQTTVSSTGVALLSGGTSPRFTVFMRVSAIPQSSGRILAWKEGGGNEMYLAKTATGFEQKWMNSSGTVQSGTYGTSTWTYDSGEHWIATTYSESVKNSGETDISPCFGSAGSYSYIDGTCVASGSGLRFRGNGIATLTIGGADLNDTDVATDMVIEEAYQCSEALTAAQVATVTTALQKGWKPTSSGTALTGTSVQLPNRTETVSGTITVAADGSYKFFGTMPSSLLPSSGGVAMPATVTVSGPEGIAIANDGTITMGGAGSIQISTSTRPITVMMKVEDIPSTQSVLAGITLANSKGMTFTRTATGFQNGEASGTSIGTNNGSGWGAASTTAVSDGAHWLTLTYEHTANGTHSYMDGDSVACSTDNNALRYSGSDVSTVSIGGSTIVPLSNYTSAKGMVIKDVQIYSQRLTAAQVKTITAALEKGWTPTVAAGTTLGGVDVELPDGTAHVTGQIVVASDGSYTFSGALQVLSGTVTVTSGTTLTSVAAGATVLVNGGAPATLEQGIAGGYSLSATLTVPETIDGTIALVDSNGNEATGATSTYENGVRSFTGTAPANPAYTGSAWWWDYEFNGNGNNIGSDATALKWDRGDGGRPTQTGGSAESLGDYTTAVDGNQAVYLLARPWRNVTSYPSEFTAVMYCKAGTTANAVLVSFGSSTEGSKKVIALTTGDDPSQGQMRLVLIDANSGVQTATDLVQGGFTLDNITTSAHLYAFTVKTVDGNSQITVYADGDLLTTYEATGEIILGSGFQVGSIHGSIQDWMGLSYLVDGSNSTTPDTATMDFLRVSNTALTSEVIKALAKEYPYVSLNGIATRVVEASGTWSDDTNTPWSQKTLNQDGSSTTTDQAAPNSGTVVDVIATADATLTMNLDSAVTYEKLTFEGAGAITVVKGGTAPTVTTRTYIKTNTTLPVDAFASLGAITVDAGKTLTLIPASSTTYTALGLGIRGTASTVLTGTVTLGNGATVALDANTVAEYAAAGISLSLEQNASLQYVLVIERQDGDIVITKTANGTETATMGGYTLPAIPATIPSDFANSVTIVNNNPSEFTVATVFNGGTVPVTVNSSSAPVVLTGDSTFGGAVSGTAALTISGDITLASGGSIANTIAGAGTVTLSALTQTLTFGGAWTGTVALPAFTTSEAITLNNYGIAGSTVRVSGSAGLLKGDHSNVFPNIELGGDWTLPSFSASFANTLAKLSGAYKFTLAASSIEYTNDSQTPYFLIKDVSGFTGSLETSAAGIVLGAESKPTGREHGGKILVYGNVTVGETAKWTAPNGVVLMEDSATLTVPSGATVPEVTTSVANSYAKAAAGESSTVYSVDRYNTVTFEGANMTAARTDNLVSAIKDGDTITFTIAPESGYAVTGVTAGNETLTADNGTYSYTVENNVTITVTTASTAVTIGEATFEYYAGYAKAKSVTAPVSSGTVVEGTTWTLTVGGNTYNDFIYDSTSGTVTFAPEGGISGISVGSNAYTITASGGSTGSASSTAVAGTATPGWIQEDATQSETTGEWKDGDGEAINLAYSEGVAALSGTNTYTAAASGDGIVTITTVVKFGGDADSTVSIDSDAQAGLRVQNGVFEVYGKTTSEGTAAWQTTDVPAVDETTYTVTLTINYTTGKFTASVSGTSLGEYFLAVSATKDSAVSYKGTGEFTSLAGSFVSGGIAVTVENANDVAVGNEFIRQYLGGKTVSEATTLLDPGSTTKTDNGCNYFESYALGLNPTSENDAPIVNAAPTSDGMIVLSLTKANGNAITPAGNVDVGVDFKEGGDAASGVTDGEGAGKTIVINPASLGTGVHRFKAEIGIGAK